MTLNRFVYALFLSFSLALISAEAAASQRFAVSSSQFLFAQPNASAPAQITLSVNDSVSVSNVAPGGRVFLFGVVRGSRRGRTHVTREAMTLRDDNADGRVEFTPEIAVPLRSVWVAVDHSTGNAAAGAHSGFPLILGEIPATTFRRDAEGLVAQLEREIRRLIVLVVRPGVGAWTIFARDGDERDTDRTPNGRVAISVRDARRVDGTEPAPGRLRSGDIVVTIDPSHLDVQMTRIAK